MSEKPTPRAVFDQLISGIGEGRWNDLADLYAEDAVVDQPMMVPQPMRINGRENVRSHFANAANAPLRLRPHNIVVHATEDPEVIIAEFDYDVNNNANGRAFTMANVQVLRIRDGLIVSTRDYHDHLRLAAVGGVAEKVAAALG